MGRVPAGREHVDTPHGVLPADEEVDVAARLPGVAEMHCVGNASDDEVIDVVRLEDLQRLREDAEKVDTGRIAHISSLGRYSSMREVPVGSENMPFRRNIPA